MTLEKLAEVLATKLQLSKSTATDAVHTIGHAISEALASGDRVTLPGVGNLSVGQRAARQGRNPRTGETISIPAKNVVKFSAAAALDRTINP